MNDETLTINAGRSDEYIDTHDAFQLDYGGTVPKIPAPYTGRLYEPGVRHFLYTDERQDPQPLEWPEGDAILAETPRLLAAKALREVPPPPEPDEPDPLEARVAALEADVIQLKARAR